MKKNVVIKTNVGFGSNRISLGEEQTIDKKNMEFYFWAKEADGVTHVHAEIEEISLFNDMPTGVHLTDALSWFKKISEVRTK